MVAATIFSWPLLTLASTLRMKWTLQPCQLLPWNTAAMALTRLRWASLMTSWTPPRSRSRSSRRNSVQNFDLAVAGRAAQLRRLKTDAGGCVLGEGLGVANLDGLRVIRRQAVDSSHLPAAREAHLSKVAADEAGGASDQDTGHLWHL